MDFLQQNWHWAALAAASGALLAHDLIRNRGRNDLLSPVEATLLINREDALVVDVRDTGEFGQGHIPNARHIPLADIDRRIGELEKFRDTPIVLCCATGARSSAAQQKLAKAGFSRLFNLRGGMGEWERAGQPVSRKRK